MTLAHLNEDMIERGKLVDFRLSLNPNLSGIKILMADSILSEIDAVCMTLPCSFSPNAFVVTAMLHLFYAFERIPFMHFL